MKIFHALLRLTILTHALATIVTPPNVPAVFDGYVDTKSIKNREPNFQVNGTDLALDERGVDGGDIESRQIPGEGVMLIVIAVIIVIGLAADLAYHIKEDILVSSNSMLLVSLAVTIIRHSVVRRTPSR